MIDLEKLTELVKSVKNNPTVLATLVIGSVGAIGTGAYNGITYYNEMKSMVTGYSDTDSTASAAKRKADALEEKVASQQEAIIKIQEKLSDALINAKEAKVVSDSTQKEARASANAQKVELEATRQELKAELSAVKKATTNRLGN